MTADSKLRRFRFSLRSLILLVALAGSGYGLWARWEPWVRMNSQDFYVVSDGDLSWVRFNRSGDVGGDNS